MMYVRPTSMNTDLPLTSDQGPVQESEESISVSSTTYVRLTVQS